MRVMEISGHVDYPAERVWATVSDFGGLDRWNAAIKSITTQGSGVGMVRTFSTATSVVQERIVELDESARRIRYEIVSGSTIPVRNAILTIAVEASTGQSSLLKWSLDGEPDGVSLEVLSEQTSKRYTGRIEDLRQYLASAG